MDLREDVLQRLDLLGQKGPHITGVERDSERRRALEQPGDPVGDLRRMLRVRSQAVCQYCCPLR